MFNYNSWGLPPLVISLCKSSRSFYLNWTYNGCTGRHSWSLTRGKTQKNSMKKKKEKGQEDWGDKSDGKRKVRANKSSLSARFFYCEVLEQTDRIAASGFGLMKDLSHSFTGSKGLSPAEKGGQLLLPWSDFGSITWIRPILGYVFSGCCPQL